ncbi:TetR/AcrR family transcriptional regulator [Brachybacterium sp. MASK1Z-5]|uniref:TetR/AcrR family transcriptional regulator n=1 Tax=Brachybacterium halotolerans TaxID=2795215 RepID=A0ABS1BAI2_9MICO|nr:TetR/AcrR family transcriptional regulator [Brachybacterium halotolerans]MBK0331663.1 TetR/AcrR family transcriptional regulator [Brachybacterium halotolerans]
MGQAGTAPSSTTAQPTRRAGRAQTRERILESASDLFYAQGIRATSADRIIEMAGITKVTFYRHFRTKSDLVVAYLEMQATGERAWLTGLRVPGAPEQTLQGLAAGIGTASCSPGFRGCAFINAAAEFADPDDPVRTVVHDQRTWMLGQFEEIAEEAGAGRPSATARELMLLRDGAMVNGYVGEPSTVGEALGGAFASVIAAAKAP